MAYHTLGSDEYLSGNENFSPLMLLNGRGNCLALMEENNCCNRVSLQSPKTNIWKEQKIKDGNFLQSAFYYLWLCTRQLFHNYVSALPY